MTKRLRLAQSEFLNNKRTVVLSDNDIIRFKNQINKYKKQINITENIEENEEEPPK